jgi:hypothetical protein
VKNQRHRSLTLAAQKDALPSRDREGVGALADLFTASHGRGSVTLTIF